MNDADLHKIGVKLFVENDSFDPTEFVPIFHRWIQEQSSEQQSLDGHLLIDVADYAHVAEGPGTVLVSAQANIHMDRGDNRLGLLYVRKQPIAGARGFADNLRGVLDEAIKTAAKLEASPELGNRLKFRTREVSIRLHDRLMAPNTSETFARLWPDVELVAKEMFGEGARIEQYRAGSKKLLDIRIAADQVASV